MGFLSGLILGIAFGIGVVVVFVRSENARSKIRRDLVVKGSATFCSFGYSRRSTSIATSDGSFAANNGWMAVALAMGILFLISSYLVMD